MYLCLFILFASLFLCQVSTDLNEPIERIIQDYYNSESVKKFRNQWRIHRKPLEYALVNALKETVGVPGMNVYVRKLQEELAAGYFHNDNQVRLILQGLELDDMPRCWWPDLQCSLASNVIRIQTSLSRMIIHANYALIRNKTDVIYEPKDQDPYKSSPFLFQQVQETGKIAISIEGCALSGYIITTLSGESVNLGYSQFNIQNCVHTVEIYRPGEDSPPVIAKYNPYRKGEEGLSITHLLLKPFLEEDLVPKLQTALYSFVNTTAIFGNALEEFRENQEIVFQATGKYVIDLVRNLNRITIEKNNGAIALQNYTEDWDDGRVRPSNRRNVTKKITGESLKLSQMVLTGLETMYSAYTGGPYMMDTVMIAEEIRFSSLQVRGKLDVKTKWSDTFAFSAEISDMAIDLELGQSQSEKDTPLTKKTYGFMKLEVKGLRRLSFTVPSLIFGSAESMIGGYLMNVVPKLIKTHLTSIFPEALQSKGKPLSPTPLPDSSDPIMTDARSDDGSLDDEEDISEDYNKIVRGKLTLKKKKKRFMSANWQRPRMRHHGSSKHAADNKIRK